MHSLYIIHSKYGSTCSIIHNTAGTYKAPSYSTRLLLSHLCLCADRHHQGHRRGRAHPRRGRLLRRGLLLRDGRAHPQRRHRLPRRHLDPHLRDQLLHPPHKNARPVHRPPPLHDTVHRARVREVQGGWQDRGLCTSSSPSTISQPPTLSATSIFTSAASIGSAPSASASTSA